MIAMDLLAAFAIPSHALGRAALRETARQRGIGDLVEIQAFEAAYPGAHLDRSDEAHEVEVEEFLGLARLNAPQNGTFPVPRRFGHPAGN